MSAAEKDMPGIETDWTYENIARRRSRFLSPSLRTFTAFERPIVLKRGEMQYVWDESGKKYLDCLAQNLCISVGHNHPLVVSEATKQSNELVHCTTMYYHPVPAHLAEELVSKMPGTEDWVVHFVNSGAEAVDLAILMARLYTGNFDVLALRNSFHGLHFASMSLTGISGCRHAVPPSPGILHTHNPDQYRGIHGATVTPYVNEVDVVIKSSTPGQIAGFIAEPIQGYGGVIPLPIGYLDGASKLVRSAGGVCIIDEIQTGFGRMGTHYWGFEMHGIIPDIVVMAKGIANGYPLAAVVAKREVAEAMSKKKFFNTYGSNPVSCAAGRAVLRVIETEKIQENARTIGAILKNKLMQLKNENPVIGDVRGNGLMIGVELVRDPESRLPAPEIAAIIAEGCKNRGLIVGRGGTNGNVLRINPPMCINEQDVQFLADVLNESCRAVCPAMVVQN
jgi:alanine-glyoxylate transaminase/(R)-3-amino-2-methylpropionate-pyruvate transaminase